MIKKEKKFIHWAIRKKSHNINIRYKFANRLKILIKPDFIIIKINL